MMALDLFVVIDADAVAHLLDLDRGKVLVLQAECFLVRALLEKLEVARRGSGPVSHLSRRGHGNDQVTPRIVAVCRSTGTRL